MSTKDLLSTKPVKNIKTGEPQSPKVIITGPKKVKSSLHPFVKPGRIAGKAIISGKPGHNLSNREMQEIIPISTVSATTHTLLNDSVKNQVSDPLVKTDHQNTDAPQQQTTRENAVTPQLISGTVKTATQFVASEKFSGNVHPSTSNNHEVGIVNKHVINSHRPQGTPASGQTPDRMAGGKQIDAEAQHPSVKKQATISPIPNSRPQITAHTHVDPVQINNAANQAARMAGKSAAEDLAEEKQPVSLNLSRTKTTEFSQSPVVMAGKHEKAHAQERLIISKMQHGTNQPVRAQRHESRTYEMHAQQPWANTQSANSPPSQPSPMIAGTMHGTDSLAEAGNGQRQAPTQINTHSFPAHVMDTASAMSVQVNHAAGEKYIPGSGPWTVLTAMQEIGHAAAQKKFQLELTLEPAHLGKIHVYLDSDANKQIQIHLEIDQPASRQTIEQHLPALRHALAQQGLNMGSFSMASGQDQDSFHSQQEHGLSADSAMAGDKPLSTSKHQAPATSTGRLSIHI